MQTSNFVLFYTEQNIALILVNNLVESQGYWNYILKKGSVIEIKVAIKTKVALTGNRQVIATFPSNVQSNGIKIYTKEGYSLESENGQIFVQSPIPANSLIDFTAIALAK